MTYADEVAKLDNFDLAMSVTVVETMLFMKPSNELTAEILNYQAVLDSECRRRLHSPRFDNPMSLSVFRENGV